MGERAGGQGQRDQGQQGAPDVIRFGSARPRSRRWPGWLVLAVLLAAVIVVAVLHRKRPPAAPPAVRVTQAGHRLLGVASGWNLFGLGQAGVVRIQLERGRVTRTAVPALDSTGPLSFVVGPHQALIRPLDLVPGYLVADGRPARSLPAALSHGGLIVVPGPAAGLVWLMDTERSRIVLYALASGAARVSLSLRPGLGPWQVGADGRGGVLLADLGGSFYDAGPGGVRLITTDTVVAVGPTGWLTVRCGTSGRCAYVVIDPASGTRRVLPGKAPGPSGEVGVIAPDGSAAAVFQAGPGAQSRLELIGLRSGATRSLPIVLRGSLGSPALAWSPDSRWLLTVAADGQLRAVDARTGLARSLGVVLPPLTELAIRS